MSLDPYRISVKKFRQVVDGIRDERDSALIKVAYLCAARNCEIITKTNPVEVLHNSSKPYGTFLNYAIEKFEVKPATEKEGSVVERVLVITSAVAKRGKRLKKQDDNEKTLEVTQEEVEEAFTKFGQLDLLDRYQSGDLKVNPFLVKVLLGKIFLKVVALPISPVYEPWTEDLLRWIQKSKNHKLSFDLTRRRLTQILRENLSNILPKVNKKNPRNPLRHFRLTHLAEYYNFSAMDLTTFAGWSIASASRKMGVPTSSNVDLYIHYRWQTYFPRLLKPLNELT